MRTLFALLFVALFLCTPGLAVVAADTPGDSDEVTTTGGDAEFSAQEEDGSTDGDGDPTSTSTPTPTATPTSDSDTGSDSDSSDGSTTDSETTETSSCVTAMRDAGLLDAWDEGVHRQERRSCGTDIEGGRAP